MKLKVAIIVYSYLKAKLARNFINSFKIHINYFVDDKPDNLIKSKNEIELAIGMNDFKKIKDQIPDLFFLNISN
jgi:hypothetical protein